MNDQYQAALDYLYGYVNFEHRRIDHYAAEYVSLDRPAELLARLDDPHHQFPAIHIAGTKGKGSVAAMCASVLRQIGLRVGLYTSPHLQDFRDRFRILSPADADGRISQSEIVELVTHLRPAAEQVPGLTWFELVTALAFLHFARQEVDVAVIEVGLGGRLDATNVLKPLVSVITSLSLDHTYLLGDSLAEIAFEKGGIIKPGVPTVTAPQATEALARLVKIAADRRSPLIVVGQDWLFEASPEPPSDLPAGPLRQYLTITHGPETAFIALPQTLALNLVGRHQLENAVVAVAALDQVHRHFPQLTLEALTTGLAETNWPGRLQLLHQLAGQPAIVVDCAHNVDSAEKLAQALPAFFEYRHLWLVMGITADKDMVGILQTLLPLASGTIVTSSGHPRAAEPQELCRLATSLGYDTVAQTDTAQAVLAAWQMAGPDDLICVTGSIFVVGDLLNRWDSLKSGLMMTRTG
jgi:dihydrofolate synthase / folylpolyglutamate synthase